MYQRILIPTDGSDCSEQATKQGLDLARGLGATVTFLYVVEDPLYYARTAVVSYGHFYDDLREFGRRKLELSQASARELGVESEAILIDTPVAHPVDSILQAGGDHDLTVMATHGRRGFDRLMLGSVAEGVLRRSTKPLLVIRCTSAE